MLKFIIKTLNLVKIDISKWISKKRFTLAKLF